MILISGILMSTGIKHLNRYFSNKVGLLWFLSFVSEMLQYCFEGSLFTNFAPLALGHVHRLPSALNFEIASYNLVCLRVHRPANPGVSLLYGFICSLAIHQFFIWGHPTDIPGSLKFEMLHVLTFEASLCN